MKKLAVILALFLLAGCDSFTVAPYGISADNDVALKAIGNQHVAVGAFTPPKDFDAGCRLAGPIQLPAGLDFTGYIQKAFTDELKVAGLYSDTASVSLTGSIDQLAFSSNSGSWDITVTIHSSNGHAVTATEHYDFHTSFTAEAACHDTADAFQPAVQALIGKLVTAPDFRSLMQT